MVVPVRRASDKRKTYLLLQSLPLGPGRTNVGIYYKPLDKPADYATPRTIAAKWEGSYQVSSLPSAYSTMTLLRDSSLGFFYEEETHCNRSGGGYTRVYNRLTIEVITGGKYK